MAPLARTRCGLVDVRVHVRAAGALTTSAI